MAKSRTMWRLKLRKVYVWQGPLVPDHYVRQVSLAVPNQIADDQTPATSLNDGGDGYMENVRQDTVKLEPVKVETVKQDEVKLDTVKEETVKQDEVKQGEVEQKGLLLKEMDEINNWARLGCQLYFGWYAVQYTANGLATGWLFTHNGPVPRFANLVFLIFIGTNLLGLIGTLLSLKNLLAYDLRLKEVIGRLTLLHGSESQSFPPLSPMPRQQINMVFGLCAVTLFMALAFWAVLLVQQAR